MSWNRNADRRGEAVQAVATHRKPAASIEQVAGVVANVGELKAGDRAVVGSLQGAFIFEGERGRSIFGKPVWQGNAHRRILRYALGRKRLAVVVENMGYPEIIV